MAYQSVAAFLSPLYVNTDGPSISFLETLAVKDSSRLHLITPTTVLEPISADGLSGQILAAAWYRVVLDEAELLDIQVLLSARRKGWGRRLLRCSLGTLASEGVSTCYLEVRRSNAAALALYHELGFRKVGERANYYRFQEGREDAILLSLSPLLQDLVL